MGKGASVKAVPTPSERDDNEKQDMKRQCKSRINLVSALLCTRTRQTEDLCVDEEPERN